MPKAFSYIEVIIVITIIAIITGMAALYGQTSQVRADVNAEANNLASYLRLSQSRSMSGEDDREHGIYLEGDRYTLFEGVKYTASDPENYEIKLPPTIELKNFNIGGGTEIIFTTPKGETKNNGSFDMYSSQIDKTVTFNISPFGSIDY